MKKVLLGCEIITKYNKYKKIPAGIVSTFNTRVMDYNKFPPVVEHLLSYGFNIKKIFAAEHGYYLVKTAGETVTNTKDKYTNLPVYSLYGSTKEILPDWVKDIDIIFYDINDLGLRFYTFGSTLYYVLLSAKKLNKKVVILDRPNPLTAKIVDGNILNKEYKSFVGISDLPVRHGLTQGELALYYNSEENINADLEVIPMENYNRNFWWDEIYPNVWFNPSPNINSLTTALVYSGSCLFEGINVSYGTGTTRPFELIGAPWINTQKWLDVLLSYKQYLNGVSFTKTVFVPKYGNYNNEVCYGLQIVINNRNEVKMFNVATLMISSLYETHKKNFKFIPTTNPQEKKKIYWIDKLAGGTELREFIKTKKISFAELKTKWDTELDLFKRKRQKFLIY